MVSPRCLFEESSRGLDSNSGTEFEGGFKVLCNLQDKRKSVSVWKRNVNIHKGPLDFLEQPSVLKGLSFANKICGISLSGSSEPKGLRLGNEAVCVSEQWVGNILCCAVSHRLLASCTTDFEPQ